MKRGQPAAVQRVNECPQCTTPHRCGRQDSLGARGPRCVGRADGLDDCDCLNRCGDDPWLDKGKAKPCPRRASEEAAALHRTTAGPAEYASWFPIGVHVPRAAGMPAEGIAMLWNSLPLETDPYSVVAFVRAVERFHGIGNAGALPAGHKLVPLEAPESLCGLLTGYGSDLSYMTERDRKVIIERGRDYWTDLLASLPDGVTGLDLAQRVRELEGVIDRVLLDVDDDGVAEAHDVAILAMRNVRAGRPKYHGIDGLPGTPNDQQEQP